MRKVYAKNPAEIVIVNPALFGNDKTPVKKTKIKKDPRRVAAGKKAWETTKRKQKNNTMSKRINPKGLADTGKEMLVKYTIAAIGTIGAVRVTDFMIQKFGSKLPNVVTKYSGIMVPAVAGVVLATKAKKNNQLMQGIAGGMVYAAVTESFNKFLPVATAGLSDALDYTRKGLLAESAAPRQSISITETGEVLDPSGNLIGKAKITEDRTVNAAMLAESYATTGWEQSAESFNA